MNATIDVAPFVPMYNDRLLRLIAVPVLGIFYRHIGEPSSLITLLRSPVYYVDLTVCILSVWLVWEISRFIICQLDKRYSWIEQFFQRCIIQAVAVYGILVLFVILITFLYNDIVMQKYRHELFDIGYMFVVDIPVTILILTIVQLLYYVLYLQHFYLQGLAVRPDTLASAEPPTAAPTRKNILVYFGKSLLPIAVDEVAYFYKAGEVTLVRTLENQDYRIDQTLEQLLVTLAPEKFYRLNRQIITNLEAVKEVKTDPNGKLVITLEPIYQDEVTVSRKKAKEFKEWLNG